jgi:NADPH-dependent 2,4-dienoyl-CoA reductase/sulfur reductase-like enzyme
MGVSCQPIDEQWTNVLRLTEVPDLAGLFILGSFAERVTVYSQQVRAINLVDALAGLGRLTPATRVAVIGAGFGGLTASAALARLGLHAVTLY